VAFRLFALAALLGVGLWGLLQYWNRWFRSVASAAYAAYGRGDYEGQLREAERLRTWAPAEYLFYRGIALFEMNRLEDAEQSLRQSLEQQNKPIQRALREAVLGSVLREQGRFEEAIACYERLANLRAGDWNTAREIARVLLQQGTQSREALQQARKGVEFCETRKPRVLQHVAMDLQEEVRDEGMAESLALLAWAEAVNAANPVKVEDLIVKARRHVPKNPECHVSSVALIHYYCGRAYVALGKTEQAVSEFECAARFDPKGNSGRLAKAALAVSSDTAPKA
jgi:tetratricopeptide (TPR) repeat protein